VVDEVFMNEIYDSELEFDHDDCEEEHDFVEPSEKGKSMEHLMLDIETLSTETDAAIVAVGAVGFDIMSGETKYEFLEYVPLKSAMQHGRVDAGTLAWWLGEDLALMKETIVNPGAHPLESVLEAFDRYVAGKFPHRPGPCVWANSPTFDCTIMRNAYASLDMEVPWPFREQRDVRTIIGVAEAISGQKISAPHIGTEHNPLDDAKAQAHMVTMAYRSLDAHRHKADTQ